MNSDISKTSCNDRPKPKCVSSKIWERFQALQKRTDEITKRSTEKRIKHLQKTILQNVADKLQSDEDREVLTKHDVQLPLPSTSGRVSGQEQRQPQTDAKSLDPRPDKFKEVEQYLGVNDHLMKGMSVDGAPKSGLEKKVEEAIKTGNTEKAEKLSDQLSTRDFGVKISEAVTARDYMKRKKEEEELVKSKKKKKLHWGFEHKQRWETKSNM